MADGSVDLASLALKIDATEVDPAAAKLDNLTKAGGRAEGQAKKTAGAFGGLAKGEDDAAKSAQDLERRLDALLSSVDPLYTAQRRLDGEIREANQLMKAGVLSADDYGRAMTVLTTRQSALHRVMGDLSKGAKLQTYELGNLGRQAADVFTMGLSGQSWVMILIQQGPQIADVFATAAARGVTFKAALAGVVAEVTPLIATFGPWLAGLAAVGAGVWSLVDAHDKEAKAVKDLNKALAEQHDELSQLSPWIFSTADNANLAADGQRNFDNWLRTTNVSLAEQNRLLRENTLNKLNDKALEVAENYRKAREAFDKVNKPGPTMMASPGGFGVVAPVQATDPKNNPFYREAEANLRVAKEAADAIGAYQAKMGQAPNDAFASQERQARAAAKAVQQHTQAVQVNTETVSATTVVWPEAAAIAQAYKIQMDAVATAQRGTVRTMQEILGVAPHFTTALESMAMDAERIARQAYDVRTGIEDIAYAIQHNDFTGAFSDLLRVLQMVKGAFAEGATAADKFAAISGVAQGVGSVVGGRAGATISGMGSGAAAGFQLGGPAGAAIGAAIGGALSFIGASNAKAQAQYASLFQAQKDLQAKQQVSTESIAGALTEAAKYQNRDLEYSNSMLTALRSINGQIGALANSVARSITTGGLSDTSGLGLGTSAKGPGLLTNLLSPISLLLPGLFGSKSTTELLDQGIQFNPTTFGQVGNLQGQSYADLVTTTKKKFLGITTGTKVSTSTSTGGLDGDLLSQVSGVISALGSGVIEAASAFGDAAGKAAQDALAGATIDLGKLSLKGLSSEEIENLLNATFSRVGDDLAKAGVPGLEALAKAGEGSFETLVRVAREYEVVDVSLQAIGKTFTTVGVGSIAARDRLVELAGGLDEFTAQTSFYAENFLTEAQRLQPIQKAVTIEMARLGLASVQTKEQFVSLVSGLDVSTAEGAQLYAALMAVAPAFAKVADAAAEAGTAIKSLGDQISDAIGQASSLLDEQISASSSAASTAKSAAANYRALNQSLKDSITALRGGDLSTLSPEQKLTEQRAGLDSVFGKALSGDAGALAKLPQVATDFLNASRDVNASSTAYSADFNRVMDMLAQAGVAANADAGIMDYQATLLDVQTGVLKEIRDNLVKPTPDLDLLAKQASLLETIGTLLTDQTTQLVTVNSSLVDANGNLIQGNSIVSAQTGQLVAVQSASTISLTQAQVAAVAQTIAAQQVTAAQIVASNDNGTALLVGSNASQTGALTASQTGSTGQLTAAQASAANQVAAANAAGASQVVGGAQAQTSALTAAQANAAALIGASQASAAGQVVSGNAAGVGQIVGGQTSTSGQIVTAQQAAAAAITAAQSLLGVNLGGAIGQQTGQINASQSQTAGQIVLSQLGLNTLLTTGNQTATQQNGLIQAGNLLINAQTGVVTTLDGHVVTGNTLINAQTGAVTSVGGAVKDQTGAVVTGNQSTDAIKNINALNNQYSEETLKALVASNVTQDATFGSLLTGNNTMVGLLQQIRDLTAAKTTQDAAAAAAAAAQAAAAAVAAAQAAAAAAAQQAAQQAADAAAAAAQQPNWSSYLTSNPDVMAEYNRLSKNYLKTLGIYTPEQFAQYHWTNNGQYEGRKPYAKGGVFTNGIVTQPTMFDASIMGEGGRPEAIVPLVRGPQGLGVRMSGANDNFDAQIAALLREIRVELQAARMQRGVIATATIEKLDKVIDSQDAQTRATRRAA